MYMELRGTVCEGAGWLMTSLDWNPVRVAVKTAYTYVRWWGHSLTAEHV
jgi:hypothetical protein